MNKQGKRFLRIVQSCVEYWEQQPPEKRARGMAFSMLVLIDGSGEGQGTYRLVTEKGEPVEFNHHDLRPGL